MKHNSKTKQPMPGNRDILTSKSFESTQRRKPSKSQDPKEVIELNDSANHHEKPKLPKKLIAFLQKAPTDKQTKKKDKSVSKEYTTPYTLLHQQDSIHSESTRKSESSEEDLIAPIYITTKNLPYNSKGELHILGQKLNQTTEMTQILTGKLAPKDNVLSSTNEIYFQTYDNEFSQKRKNSAGNPSNKVVTKDPSPFKRLTSSSTIEAKPSSSKTKTKKINNRSFNSLDLSNKQRSSPLQKRSCFEEKNDRLKAYCVERCYPPIKRRKHQEPKKTKSFVSDKRITNISREQDSSLMDKTLQYDNTRDTKDTFKEIKLEDNIPNIATFTEKEILEANESLIGYYNLLIERDNVNSKLILSLKENFCSVIKEFENNYRRMKKHEDTKLKYDKERQRANKEKELLEYKLNALQIENERLKNLNTKIRANNQEYFEKHTAKPTENSSTIAKEIQRVVKEEQRLVDLLCQQEEMISYLKAKENKYIGMIEALGTQGINVNKIYKDYVKSKGDVDQRETKIKTLPDAFCEIRTNKGFGGIPSSKMVNKVVKKKGSNRYTEGDEQLVSNQSKKRPERSDPEKVPTQCDESVGDFQKSKIPSLITGMNLKKRESPPVREVSLRSKYKSFEEAEVKDKLKLDLSSIQDKVIKEYHDEFMDKWPEFTSSWKRAMRKDKTFDHHLHNVDD